MGDNEFTSSITKHEGIQDLPPKTEVLQKIIRLREAIEIAMKTLNAMLENNERTPQFQELELTIADLKTTEQKLSVMVLAYPAEPQVDGTGQNENVLEVQRQGDAPPHTAAGPPEGDAPSIDGAAGIADCDIKQEPVDTTKPTRRPTANVEGASSSRRPVNSDHVSSTRDKNASVDTNKLRDPRESEGRFVPLQGAELRQSQQHEGQSTSGSDTRGVSPERSKEAFLEHLQYIHANLESPSERMLTVLASLRLFFSKEEAAEVAQDFFSIHETFWDIRRRSDVNYLKQQCMQNPASAPDLLRTQGMHFGDLGPYYNNQFQDYPEMDDSFGDTAGSQGMAGFEGEGRAPDYLMTHSDVMVNEIRAMPQPMQPAFARDEEMEVSHNSSGVQEPRSYSAFNLPTESDFTTNQRNVNDERRDSDKSCGMYGELLDFERDFYRDSASKAQSLRVPYIDPDMLRDEIREFFIQNLGRSDAPDHFPNPARTQKLRSLYYELFKTKLPQNEKRNRPESPYSLHAYGPEKDNDSSRNSAGINSKLTEKDGESGNRFSARDVDYFLNFKARSEGSRPDLTQDHSNRPRGYGNNLSFLPNYDHTSGDHTDRQQGRSSTNPVAGPSQPGPTRKASRYANFGKDTYPFEAEHRFQRPSDYVRNNTPPRESLSSSGQLPWSYDRGDRGDSPSSNRETLKQLIALLDGQRRQISNAETVMRQNAVKISRLERELGELRNRNLELERHVYNHRYSTRTGSDRYVNTSNLSNDVPPRREMHADHHDLLHNYSRDFPDFDRLVRCMPLHDELPRNNSTIPTGNSTYGNGAGSRPFPMRLSHLNGTSGSMTPRESGLSDRGLHDQLPGYSGSPSEPRRNQHAGILNNQVPPGNRANNYWDNFRSYSRQNLLSSPKFNGSLNAPSGTSGSGDLRMRGSDEVNNFNAGSSTNKIHRPNTRVGKSSAVNSQHGKLFMGRHFVENIPVKNRNEEEDSDEIEDEDEASEDDQDRDRNRN